MTLIANCVIWYNLLEESKLYPEIGMDKKAFGEVIYDVFQVAILLAYAVVKLDQQSRSEVDAREIIQQFSEVPFRDPDQTVSKKVNDFFLAVNSMNDLLSAEDTMQKIGFFVMLLMLIRIINATAVHPRTGVLIGTMREGLNDLWHFAILFLIIFYFFSQVSFWSFNSRAQFGDQSTAMVTQFDILLGSLPENFQDDWLLIIYVAMTNVIMFFLMLNFLLAIVVEAYMKVREQIEESETENEITYDLILTMYFTTVGVFKGWPNRRVIGFLLKHRLARRAVSWTELHVLGVPEKSAKAFIESYSQLDTLEPQPFETIMTVDKIGEACKESLKLTGTNTVTVRGLERRVEAISRGMELLLQRQLGDEFDPAILRPEPSGAFASFASSRPASAVKPYVSLPSQPRPVSSVRSNPTIVPEISSDEGKKKGGPATLNDEIAAFEDQTDGKSRGGITLVSPFTQDSGTKSSNVAVTDLPGQAGEEPVRDSSQTTVDQLAQEVGIASPGR
eukprot:CAMPEP_0184304488 /NCGR_PEP_ID=MMETSP1049-20130417/13989_1 /TAXON_ID=77928 /ORGANISM="Proteomonas sulcata, Strain CCMP704" /LENGTH=503 /DNA_ID=CAMNT_0026616303 /DNA_START=36 /DNA_END=1547 /DNA_ORIENTATION=+